MTGTGPASSPSISIIIPASQETGLDAIQTLFASEKGVELVFALAEDDPNQSAPEGSIYVRAPRGRASQMNAGAEKATGDILLFLHADTTIAPTSLEMVRRVLSRPGVAVGAFSLKINGPGICLRLIAAVANLRSRALNMPYGDQALFLTKEVFNKIGGYPNVPILEDVLLVEAAGRLGALVVLPEYASTSARRWEKEGIAATTLRHWGIIIAHKLGASPRRIAEFISR